MPVKNGNEVRVEKVLNSSPQDVFRALSKGMLFSNCGADGEKLKVDFRVGGGYESYFMNGAYLCRGKFIEIVPDRKIVFTWGDEGSDEGFPRTRVSVELASEAAGAKTKILIVHTGFKTQGEAENHDFGWNSGLDDMAAELIEGRIRLVRVFSVNRDALYTTCSDPRRFFAPVAMVEKGSVDFRVGGKYRFPTDKGEILGEFLEIIPGKKIVMSWLAGCHGMLARPSTVTLSFDDEDDGASSLELVHEGLPLGEQVCEHRQGWEYLVKELGSRLK